MGKVILATNAFANLRFPELKAMPSYGQVLVTEPIGDLKPKGTFHFNEGHYYLRNIGDRILFGGGRNLDFAAERLMSWAYGCG